MFQSSPAARGGRNRLITCYAQPEKLFQSSPAARGGRNQRKEGGENNVQRFNPRPLHAAGATGQHCGQVLPEQVSILARCTRRAQRRPGSLCVPTVDVSILARCTRRAQPGDPLEFARCANVSILARCTRRAQLGAGHVAVTPAVFQSSPAARGGRNNGVSILTNTWSGFNPRPLHAAGAT